MDGVVELDTVGEDSIPVYAELSVNWGSVRDLVKDTDGLIDKFVTSGERRIGTGQRYILLAPRRELLRRLKEKINAVIDARQRRVLEVLCSNAESYLEQYGEKAALTIL
jgi:hypothetical protein